MHTILTTQPNLYGDTFDFGEIKFVIKRIHHNPNKDQTCMVYYFYHMSVVARLERAKCLRQIFFGVALD